MDDGKNVYKVNMEKKLSIIKPIHDLLIKMITKTFQMVSTTETSASESIADEDHLGFYKDMENVTIQELLQTLLIISSKQSENSSDSSKNSQKKLSLKFFSPIFFGFKVSNGASLSCHIPSKE